MPFLPLKYYVFRPENFRISPRKSTGGNQGSEQRSDKFSVRGGSYPPSNLTYEFTEREKKHIVNYFKNNSCGYYQSALNK